MTFSKTNGVPHHRQGVMASAEGAISEAGCCEQQFPMLGAPTVSSSGRPKGAKSGAVVKLGKHPGRSEAVTEDPDGVIRSEAKGSCLVMDVNEPPFGWVVEPARYRQVRCFACFRIP